METGESSHQGSESLEVMAACDTKSESLVVTREVAPRCRLTLADEQSEKLVRNTDVVHEDVQRVQLKKEVMRQLEKGTPSKWANTV